MKKKPVFPILRDVLDNYQGKVVKIGTEGSGYFVCGALSNALLNDLFAQEEEHKETRRRQIEMMREELPNIRKGLPDKKKIMGLKLEAYEKAKSEYQEALAEAEAKVPRDRTDDKVRKRNFLIDYLERQRRANEEEIGNLSGRAKEGARRSFATWARKRKNKFNKRLRSWEKAIDLRSAYYSLMLDKVKEKEDEVDKALQAYQKAKQAVDNANGKLEAYPAKIRSYTRYLERYIPFMDREVIEQYPSIIHRDEFSLILSGREAGAFWDCEEYDCWKTLGITPKEREGKEDEHDSGGRHAD